jgi:hypothetical protein
MREGSGADHDRGMNPLRSFHPVDLRSDSPPGDTSGIAFVDYEAKALRPLPP